MKKLGGNMVFPNDVLVRQKGFKFKPGINTRVGKDFTIHSMVEGRVKFTKEYEIMRKEKRRITTIHVLPEITPKKSTLTTNLFCYHPE